MPPQKINHLEELGLFWRPLACFWGFGLSGRSAAKKWICSRGRAIWNNNELRSGKKKTGPGLGP